MNRDPSAWARLGKALARARQAKGLSQQELAVQADVSHTSVQNAEAGQVPKSRMPYTVPAIAAALGWPEGAVQDVLEGSAPPGGWRDVPVQVDVEERYESIITNAMVRATEGATSAEIKKATKIAMDEFRRQGLI